MDERQELNAGKAAMIVLMLVVLVALGVLVWDYLADHEVTNTWAIVTLLGAGGLFVLLNHLFGAEAPKDIFGRDLPTGDSAAERSERRRSYLLSAVVLALGLTVIGVGGLLLGDREAMDWLPTFMAGTVGLVLTGIVSFVAEVAIFYGVNHVLGETQARAVERSIAKYNEV